MVKSRLTVSPAGLVRGRPRRLHGGAAPLAQVVPVGAHLRVARLEDAGREPQAAGIRGVGCTGNRPRSPFSCFRATFGHVVRLRATFGHSRALFRLNFARERWPCPNPAREWQNVRFASESRPTTQAMSQSGPGTAGVPGSSESRPNARGDLNRPVTLTAQRP